jgi:peptide/nickel transport system ATP-binding protein
MRLEAKNISFQYTKKGNKILNNVNLVVKEGERVGLIGPSGYGKSTLGKILSGYELPVTGTVLLDGNPLSLKGVCPVQLIYQHPDESINPRWKMGKVLEESNQLNEEVMDKLGIEREWLTRYPRELSGGELQRFSVARALSKSTRFLIADEISTMLDVITAAQLWNYILHESNARKMGLIVITHNMELAKRVCTRVIDLRDINKI